MNDILPPHVIEEIRAHYALGIANAEAFYDEHSADEDAVTGALGQALARAEPFLIQKKFDEYLIHISYRKIRGRGPNAPERLLGIDGIFQLSVKNIEGDIAAVKGLPFQSKKNWKGVNKELLGQVVKMEHASPGGIVIDFSSSGYKACTTADVIASNGSRTVADRHHSIKSLQQILCYDFLDCRVGRRGLFFDPKIETLAHRLDFFNPVHIFTTIVEKRKWG